MADSSLDLYDQIALISRNAFAYFQLTKKLCPFLLDGHLGPVIHAFVTSSMNPCNRSGIWNLWMDPEGDCWLFPWYKVLLAQYVWIQAPQKASTFSRYLFTALDTIFKASEEISEIAAYLWCALDHRFKKKKKKCENYSQYESDFALHCLHLLPR